MNNKYYRVRIAINEKLNMIVGTTLETIFDWAMPYDTTYWKNEYKFKEKSFETEQEAREYKALYDKYICV